MPPHPARPLLGLLWALAVACVTAADKSFLYAGSTVQEVGAEAAEELRASRASLRATHSRHPHVTVFYAHWCGHCQQYAPKFKALAAKHNRTTIDPSGRGKEQPEAFFSTAVAFYGVNCVKFSSLCDDYGVKAYPSVRAFDFPDDAESLSWKGVNVKASGVDGYLKEHAQTGGGGSGRGAAGASAVDAAALQLWLSKTAGPLPLGPVASAEDRWRDASETLFFLLLVELDHAPSGLRGPGPNLSAPVDNEETQVRIKVLAQVATAMALFLPQNAALKSVMLDISALLQAAAPSKEAILRRMQRWLAEDMRWGSCGVLKGEARVDSGVADGYTCGLWFLLHALTVGAQAHQGDITTHRIMSLIRSLVNLHFRCEECRHHFVAAFDDCSWGRCEVGPWDFRALQLWLWKFHNKVTHRILSYRFLNGQFSLPVKARVAPEGLGDIDNTSVLLYPDVLWPASQDCPTCRTVGQTVTAAAVNSDGQLVSGSSYYRRENHVLWNDDAIVKHLRRVYASQATGDTVSVEQQDYFYDFINQDFDRSSRLDDHAQVIGDPAMGGTRVLQFIQNPGWVASVTTLTLYAVYAYRHVLCRVLLTVTGGIIGSPRMSATCKTSSDHKSAV